MNRTARFAACLAVIAFATTAAAAPPDKAPGKTKSLVVTTLLKGKDTARSTAAVGDRDDHELMQRVYSYDVASKDPDFDGARTENFAQTDSVAGNGSHRGYAVWHARNGDRVFVHFEGEHRKGDKDETDFSGHVEFTGGTGKFAHIRGHGTYRGHITPTQQSSEATFEDVSY
jgi:hypothetical protein